MILLRSFLLSLSLICVTSHIFPEKCESVRNRAKICDAQSLMSFEKWPYWEVISSYYNHNDSYDSADAFPEACPEMNVMKHEKQQFFINKTYYWQRKKFVLYEELSYRQNVECSISVNTFRDYDCIPCKTPGRKGINGKDWEDKFPDVLAFSLHRPVVLDTDYNDWMALWFCFDVLIDRLYSYSSSQSLFIIARSNLPLENKIQLQSKIVGFLSRTAKISNHVLHYDLQKCSTIRKNCPGEERTNKKNNKGKRGLFLRNSSHKNINFLLLLKATLLFTLF